jgi:hypothetical protein
MAERELLVVTLAEQRSPPARILEAVGVTNLESSLPLCTCRAQARHSPSPPSPRTLCPRCCQPEQGAPCDDMVGPCQAVVNEHPPSEIAKQSPGKNANMLHLSALLRGNPCKHQRHPRTNKNVVSTCAKPLSICMGAARKVPRVLELLRVRVGNALLACQPGLRSLLSAEAQHRSQWMPETWWWHHVTPVPPTPRAPDTAGEKTRGGAGEYGEAVVQGCTGHPNERGGGAEPPPFLLSRRRQKPDGNWFKVWHECGRQAQATSLGTSPNKHKRQH